MFNIECLSKKICFHNNEQIIFDELTYKFPEKGLIVILGESGSGKTTLLNILAGIDRQYTGKVSFFGKSISDLSQTNLLKYRRQNIAFIHQNFNLCYDLSVEENILLSNGNLSKKHTQGKLAYALQTVSLESCKSKKVKLLSGGEQQRLAIARAIFSDKKAILADEPTESLDTKNANTVIRLLKNLSKDKLVILVTHNNYIAQNFADIILTLENGKIISDDRLSPNSVACDCQCMKELQILPEPFTKNNEILKLEQSKTNLTLSTSIKKRKKVKQIKIATNLQKHLNQWFNILFTTIKLAFADIKGNFLSSLTFVVLGIITSISLLFAVSVKNSCENYAEFLNANGLNVNPIFMFNQEMRIDLNKQYKPENKPDCILPTTPEKDYILLNNNSFDNNFLLHIDTMKQSYNCEVFYDYLYSLPIFAKQYNGTITKTNEVTLKRFLLPEFETLKANTTLVFGQYPQQSDNSKNNILLMLNEDDTISSDFLNLLGIKTFEGNSIINIEYANIIGKSVKLATNDAYYQKTETGFSAKTNASEIWNDEKCITLTITGIAKHKPNSSLNQIGIGYTQQLLDFIFEDGAQSEIAKFQQSYSEKDVFTNLYFLDNAKELLFSAIDIADSKTLFDALNANAQASNLSLLQKNELINKAQKATTVSEIYQICVSYNLTYDALLDFVAELLYKSNKISLSFVQAKNLLTFNYKNNLNILGAIKQPQSIKIVPKTLYSKQKIFSQLCKIKAENASYDNLNITNQTGVLTNSLLESLKNTLTILQVVTILIFVFSFFVINQTTHLESIKNRKKHSTLYSLGIGRKTIISANFVKHNLFSALSASIAIVLFVCFYPAINSLLVNEFNVDILLFAPLNTIDFFVILICILSFQCISPIISLLFMSKSNLANEIK